MSVRRPSEMASGTRRRMRPAKPSQPTQNGSPPPLTLIITYTCILVYRSRKCKQIYIAIGEHESYCVVVILYGLVLRQGNELALARVQAPCTHSIQETLDESAAPPRTRCKVQRIQ